MATSTQLAQALALKKQNPNLTTRDAALQVKQATTPVTPTPTPIAPTPPVTPTQNFPSQPLNQQTTTGVNGETFQVAPVNAQGVTPQAPTQPTTPAPATPTTPAPTAPLDKTAEIQAKNQAQMEANAQKSQLAIQERKKAAEDAKLANIPTDQKSILTSLVSGVSVPQQNTAAYRSANLQYKNYQKFNAMTPQQLLDNMKMGEIDTATSQLLANNPSYIKAKEDFDKFQKNQSINQMVQSVTNGVKGTTETVDYAQQASDSLAKKLGIDQTNAEAYATIVSKNPEVVQLAGSVKSLTNQLNTLVQERNTIYKELKQQYPDLSASAIMTLMASRTQKWSTDIDALNASLSSQQANLKTAMEIAKWEYEATKEDIALQAGIAKEDRAKANEKPTFQQYGDKVYQVVNGKLVDTWINTASDQWQSANITRYNPLTGANESTPIFYKKKSGWAGFEAVDLAWNPIDANVLWWLSSTTTGGWVSTWTYATWSEAMRTDRNMNPTAFTTDIAKQAGLIEWVDYVQWDKFPWKSNLYTAKLIWDPIETTIRVIDSIGFKTKSGQDRWVYTAKLWLNNETWAKMSPMEKENAVKRMYQQEGGNWTAIWENKTTTPQFEASDVKAFENFDWKTIPAQYSKTPLLQQEFIKKYNDWRASQANVQIKTGEDILNVQLSDKATEQEKNAIQYGSRMLNAINDLAPLESEFAKLPLQEQLYQEFVPNLLKSDNQKTLEARKKDFITAVLRKESGASISPTEFANEEKKYFVQPWDSPSVIAAKQNARNFAIKAILSAAGKDINGKLVSSLYNPEAIVPQSTTNTNISSRIKAIRAKANQK